MASLLDTSRVRVVDIDSSAVDCLRAFSRYLFASMNRGFRDFISEEMINRRTRRG